MTRDDQRRSDEAAFLRQAIELALGNVAAERAPFGALVVRDAEVLGIGVNTVGPDMDPTAHAEVAAVRAAARRLDTANLTGTTVYSSCEPCAMCHTVCAVAGVGEIVYAAPKEFVPDLGGDPSRDDLMRMQHVLRTLAQGTIRHVDVPGADEPFRRYVQRRGGQA